jgi:hypothetical protein
MLPLSRENVRWDGDSWRIDATAPGHVRLFEVELPRIEQCMLTYRIRMQSQAVQKGAYLEMWCRVVGRGEFYSKGLMQKGPRDRGLVHV